MIIKNRLERIRHPEAYKDVKVFFEMSEKSIVHVDYFLKNESIKHSSVQSLIQRDISIRDVEGIKRSIEFFKWMRRVDGALLVITTHPNLEDMKVIKEKLQTLIVSDYEMIEHENTCAVMIHDADDALPIIREYAVGDTMMTLYYRDGVVVFCEGEDVYDKSHFNVGDYHVLSDTTGEMIRDLLLADFIESVSYQYPNWEEMLMSKLTSPFISSFVNVYNHPDSSFYQHIAKGVHTLSELFIKMYQESDPSTIWDYPLEVIYYMFRKEKEHEI